MTKEEFAEWIIDDMRITWKGRVKAYPQNAREHLKCRLMDYLGPVPSDDWFNQNRDLAGADNLLTLARAIGRAVEKRKGTTRSPNERTAT